MKDLIDLLKDAFPALKSHPRLILAAFVTVAVLVTLYRARGVRAKVCIPLASKLYRKIVSTQRWLFVFKPSNTVNEWKYYTSESSGRFGDDIIWTLVEWPSLKPRDSFRVVGAIGLESALADSQVRLQGRWQITHNPDNLGIGFVPARGVRSWFRRVAAKVLHTVGSI